MAVWLPLKKEALELSCEVCLPMAKASSIKEGLHTD